MVFRSSSKICRVAVLRSPIRMGVAMVLVVKRDSNKSFFNVVFLWVRLMPLVCRVPWWARQAVKKRQAPYLPAPKGF